MKFYFFGVPRPGNRMLDEADKMTPPVGDRCDYCGELIEVGDSGYGVALSDSGARLLAHNNCFLAATIIPAHTWIPDDDEGGLTPRQIADKVIEDWRSR